MSHSELRASQHLEIFVSVCINGRLHPSLPYRIHPSPFYRSYLSPVYHLQCPVSGQNVLRIHTTTKVHYKQPPVSIRIIVSIKSTYVIRTSQSIPTENEVKCKIFTNQLSFTAKLQYLNKLLSSNLGLPNAFPSRQFSSCIASPSIIFFATYWCLNVETICVLMVSYFFVLPPFLPLLDIVRTAIAIWLSLLVVVVGFLSCLVRGRFYM